MSNFAKFNFFRYFDEILKNSTISMNAKIVYLYLCRCHGKDGKINPRIVTISKKISLSLTRTKYALKELSDQKMIKSYRTGRRNRYELLPIKISPEVDYHDSPDMSRQGSDSPKPSLKNSPDVDYQMAQKHTISNNKTKIKQKKNNNVVVASPEVSLLLDRIREGVNLEDKGLFEILNEGLEKYGYEPMVDRIEYVNQKANGNYPGFLASMIRKGWSFNDEKKGRPTPPSEQLPSANSLAGKIILFKGEKYIVDPAGSIKSKYGGWVPIGSILQGLKKGSMKLIDC